MILDLPVYETTLPVEKNNVEFSPLVVKEEKNIAIAKEAGSKSDSYGTFLKILSKKFNLNPKKLSEPDLIHCIIELRKKSISDEVIVNFKCPHTGAPIKIKINCNDIQLKGTSRSTKIQTDDYNIELCLPTFKSSTSSLIHSIETRTQTIKFETIPEEKRNEILESLPVMLKNEIEKASSELFHYSYDLKYSSDSDYTIPIRSAEDFFTLCFAM
jgi:hypothetical protein|tara:strand:+ start:472 stop:1113 length:642 start_codon:yes stop_codon:yes gene_type:complete